MNTKSLIRLSVVASLLLAFGCHPHHHDHDTPVERAAETMEDAAEDVGDTIGDATEDMGETMEEAGDDVEDAMN